MPATFRHGTETAVTTLEHVTEIINTVAIVCVTVLVPFDGNDYLKSVKRLANSINKAKTRLQRNKMNSVMRSLLEQLLDNAVSAAPGQDDKAVGVYVSNVNAYSIPFPFGVKPRIVVRDRFSVRELFYLRQYAEPYYMLGVSSYVVRLYRGSVNVLTEIVDDYFPMHLESQYQYRSVPAGVLENPKQGNNRITSMPVRSLFRDADAHLTPYLSDSDVKLIIVGTQPYIRLFRDITTCARHIAGELRGTYHHANASRLGYRVWNLFRRNKASAVDAVLKNLRNDRRVQTVSGLTNVWNAAKEGKVGTLVVEKDFHRKAYVKPDDACLFLERPAKPYTIVDDAVDSVVEMVREKNGQVIITEDGSLGEHGHIALSR